LHYYIQQENDSIIVELYKKADSLYEAKSYTLGLQIALKVLDEAKKDNNNTLVSKTNYLIGKLWYQTGAYEKSVRYLKTSMTGLVEILQSNDSLRDSNLDIENSNYEFLDQNFQIGRAYHKLYEINEHDSIREPIYKDSTLYYYNKIINAESIEKEISLLKSRALNNLSGIYIRDSLFDKAEEVALKSVEIKKVHGDQYLRASAYNALSNIYFYRGEYEKSKEVLFKGVKELEKTKGDDADEIRAALFLNIAFSMYKLKDYMAYKWQEDSWNLYDALAEKRNEQVLADTYARWNYDKGMQEGILKEEIKRQRAQNVTWVIGVSSFFIIVLLVFFLNQYKLRQKNLNLELSRQELMQQQKLEKIKAESQIRILNATLDGKESERKEIAETLHDSVSALLSSANLHLQACKTQFNGSTPIEVDKSQSIINEASQKIRDLSHTLVSSILLKFGLSFAIKDIAEKFSNSGLKIDYDTRYIKRYDQGFEIKLYNIIQEFINNILKHSHASHAKITLVEKKKKLHLIIEDNGEGFDINQIPKKDGLGINQIDARIQMMKGKFTIETAQGKGTKIIIELPIFEKQPITISEPTQ
jgi:signal transduction histidine kinase